MKAAIIAVGSELLGTARLDTNSLWLTGRLETIGIPVVRKASVGDDAAEIHAELATSLSRAGIVLMTGGLGPTRDDLTKEAVAEYFGRPLRIDPGLLETLRSRFSRRGVEMPAINEKQALAVEGARMLENPRGSAPGVWLESGESVVVLLPGVPKEMRGMFDDEVFADLTSRFGSESRHRRILRIAAMGESAIEDRVRGVYDRWPDHSFTILGSPGEVQLHLSAFGAAPEALRVLDAQSRDFEGALPGRIYGRDAETLEHVVGARLRRAGKTLSLAESCTGGLVAQRLTEVPGSSDYFLGAIVPYSNEAKIELLGVRPATIAAHGAVSEETSREMAEGALSRFGSDFSLAVTGIAGPGGGTPEKPVGTVWVGLAERDGEVETKLLRVPGDRQTIRAWTCAASLEMLRVRLGAP
ncbi:MAG: competence/damage-inducible protein A [Thermoanaerobaculia bacterium]